MRFDSGSRNESAHTHAGASPQRAPYSSGADEPISASLLHSEGMTDFEEFGIRFDSANGVIRVLVESSSGDASETVELPPDLLPALSGLGRALRVRELGKADDEQPEWSPSDRDRQRQAIGEALYRALFRNTVEQRFRDTLKSCGDGRALRVRIKIDLGNAALAPVAHLPWELLFIGDNRYLVSPPGALIRQLSVHATKTIPAFEPPLRVLLVMANPRRDLQLNTERDGIAAAFAGAGVPVTIDRLERATYPLLCERLGETDPHVVHFMGHGDFDGSEGVLVLHQPDADGEDHIPARHIANVLRDEAQLRLVVLNACRTAEVAARAVRNPYAGIATALVQAGVPAVLAMQQPITDRGAIDFAGALYRSLGRGDTLEDAVGKARLALRDEFPIPVLFSHVKKDLFAKVVPRAPQGRTRIRTVSPDLGDLLPYTVNRREVLRELQSALREQDADPGKVLVAMVRGDDGQGHDKFIDRLLLEDLRPALGLGFQDAPIKEVPLPSPTRYTHRHALHEELTSELGNWLRKDAIEHAPARRPATQDELQRAFAEHPAPVLIHSQILASAWDRYPPSVVDDFLSYWQSWPRHVARQRLIVILLLKSQLATRTWLHRLMAGDPNSAMRASLDRMDPARYPGIIARVLPALESIDEQEVVDWNRKHDRHLSDEDIASMFATHAAGTGRTTMTMVEVATAIEQRLARRGAA